MLATSCHKVVAVYMLCFAMLCLVLLRLVLLLLLLLLLVAVAVAVADQTEAFRDNRSARNGCHGMCLELRSAIGSWSR